MNVHRWIGRVFLLGVACGVSGAVYLVAASSMGWAFGFGLLGLGRHMDCGYGRRLVRCFEPPN